jgi:hypothetical protein
MGLVLLLLLMVVLLPLAVEGCPGWAPTCTQQQLSCRQAGRGEVQQQGVLPVEALPWALQQPCRWPPPVAQALVVVVVVGLWVALGQGRVGRLGVGEVVHAPT